MKKVSDSSQEEKPQEPEHHVKFAKKSSLRDDPTNMPTIPRKVSATESSRKMSQDASKPNGT